MNNRYETLIRYFWIAMISSPFIVGLIVSIHVIDVTTNNDWIGFYCALIGGLLTYLSIYISMQGIRKQIITQKDANNLVRQQQVEDKINIIEERRLNVRPHINICGG